MKSIWTYLIGIALLFVTLVLLIITNNFSAWTFFGAIFYILLTIAGYSFIMLGKNIDNMKANEEQNKKQKFDWCWERVNLILKRMPGGQGLQWDEGTGRTSQYRSYYDGVQNHGYRSMSAYLSKTQQVVVVIYDINRDDIVRFDTNPSPQVFENHFYHFKPFSRGNATAEFDPRLAGQRPYGLHSRRMPVQVNIGGDDLGGGQGYELPKPGDDMIDSAMEKLD